MIRFSIKPLCAIIGTGVALVAESGTVTTGGGFDVTAMLEMAFKSLGPLAILGWYLYYDKSVSQPLRDRDQREERQQTIATYEARIDRIVQAQEVASAAFANSMKIQSDTFSAAIARTSDVHEKMILNCTHRIGDRGERGDRGEKGPSGERGCRGETGKTPNP